MSRFLPLLPRGVLVGVWVHQSREGGGNGSEHVRPRAQKHENTRAQSRRVAAEFLPSRAPVPPSLGTGGACLLPAPHCHLQLAQAQGWDP